MISEESGMDFDLVIRGGRVVDGTGMASYGADIGIRSGRIAKIGRIAAADGMRTVDADGLAVTPGFIDVHTHYDVQLDWDPIASPSSSHGVTSVLAGNCGFTLAPAKPEDVDWLAGLLSRVEGMSREALGVGLKFRGGSFGDYWRRFDGKLGINVGSFVGHCAVRRYVMGDAASERAATDDEIARMQDLVRAAMREGAVGFSTSQIDVHVGMDGRAVPSNHASPEEIIALCAVLAEFQRGAVEIIPRSFAEGYNDADRDLILRIYEVSGRPIELNLLLPTPLQPMGWERSLQFCRDAAQKGVRLHPQFSTNELGLHLKLADTFVFDEMGTWRETLTSAEPERTRRLRDPEVRARMRAEYEEPGDRAVVLGWDGLEVETVRDPKHRVWVGKSIRELAEERRADPLDTFLDLSLEEDLQTQWQSRTSDIGREFIEHVVRAGVSDPLVMAGSSDGGAHLASFVGADYTTRLLTDWVPDSLSFEQAIFRLTMMPAVVHGLEGRGVIREGMHADLNLIDRDRLAAGHCYLVRDFPAETERYVVDAEGYVMTIVNGEVVMKEGRHTGALPGTVIRGG
jgi:N-acyl-D-aspartate/D-glutamate deacylase